MLRKTILALAAARRARRRGARTHLRICLGRTWSWGWHGGWHGPGFRAFARLCRPGSMAAAWCGRWVYTPYGPALRWVNRCY